MTNLILPDKKLSLKNLIISIFGYLKKKFDMALHGLTEIDFNSDRGLYLFFSCRGELV